MELIKDLEGQRIEVARSRGGVLAVADPTDQRNQNGSATVATAKTHSTHLANEQLELLLQDGADQSRRNNAPVTASRTSAKKLSIQDALLAEGLLATKLSKSCETLSELSELVINNLSQNSLETRRRYVQSITGWFFPDGIKGLLPRVWRVYEDEVVTRDLLRWSYLTNEPIVGACVANALFPLENGISIPATYFDKFLSDHLGAAPPEKTRERIKINLKRIGFLERAKGKPDRLATVMPQRNSFMILLHHLFAPTSVRTVELRTLLADPFWKYLGYKSEDMVRKVLREADVAGIIGKYIVADQIEQVTTCYSLEDWLEKGIRL